MRRLSLAVAAALLLPACSGGASCGDLSALQAEREQRRAQQQELVEQRAVSDDEIGAADDRLHAFERQVLERERQCAS